MKKYKVLKPFLTLEAGDIMEVKPGHDYGPLVDDGFLEEIVDDVENVDKILKDFHRGLAINDFSLIPSEKALIKTKKKLLSVIRNVLVETIWFAEIIDQCMDNMREAFGVEEE